MLSRRAARLAHVFQLVTLAVGAPSLMAHCGSSSDEPGDGGTTDATRALVDASDASLGPDTVDAAEARDARDGASGRDTSDETLSCFATVTVPDALAPDGEEYCVYALPCGLGTDGLGVSGCVVLPTYGDGGLLDANLIGWPYCAVLEGQGCTDGSYTPTEAGVVFECVGCPGGGGRRPAGWSREAPRATDVRGAYFAEMARLEAASVRAFEDLARALAVHGAPRPLVLASLASARDEVRHARSMAGLARRFGGAPCGSAARRVSRAPSLATLARENAIEGCVRETYGALVNAWQASRASDPQVRAAMSVIARDELRHASLSWELAEWAAPRLDARTRRSIARAQRRAAGRLLAEVSREPPRALRDVAGLPDARAAQGLARGLLERLWM